MNQPTNLLAGNLVINKEEPARAEPADCDAGRSNHEEDL